MCSLLCVQLWVVAICGLCCSCVGSSFSLQLGDMFVFICMLFRMHLLFVCVSELLYSILLSLCLFVLAFAGSFRVVAVVV